jgi:diguanylate cyclase (GGDEF)-like protein
VSGRAGAAARAGRDLRARLEAQRRRPVLVRACGALFREAGPLAPAARRRALRLALRSAPALVVVGFSALLALGVFADLALGWPQAGAVGLLLAALAAVSLRRARASAAGRPATARERLELGSLYIVAAHAVAQTAAGGGLEGPLYPVVYLVMAFLVSFLPRGVGLALVAFAVGLEAVLWRGRGGLREEIPAAAAHAGFIVLFAVLYHAVLWAQLAASRGAERAAVQRRLREIDERAREYRLLAPAAGAGADPEERGRRLTEAAVVEVEAAVRGTLEVVEAALRSHTCAVFLLTPDDAELVLRECRSPSDRVAARLPSREGALGSVVARAVPLRLQGEVRAATYYEDGTRPRAFLAVPLLDRRGGHVRGVLLADRLQGEPFGDEDEALLQKLAVELLRAVAAERLMGDLQRSRDEKERFYSAIELLNRTTKLREVFDATLRVAAGIAPIDLGAVTLVEPGEGKALHRVARILLGPPDEKRAAGLDGLAFPDNAGLVASAVKLGATLPGRDLDISHAVVFDEATRLRGLASLRVIPLKTADGVLGTLVLGARREGAFGREAVRQLEVIAMQAADAVLRARLFEQTERLATTDGLTGLANHRTFQARLEEHLLAAARYGKRLSLILCDIDHFKSVNDTYGHPAGDVVLKGVARALQREARATDLVARYGGEEFAIVMPETDAPGALVIAERIREKVRALAFQTELGRLQVTLSLGVATCPDDGAKKARLVEAADACLYHAKRHGRNRTVSAATLRAGRRAAAGGSA